MHLNDEQIQRWLHDELDTPTRASLAQHLAECEACTRKIALADAEEKSIFDLLGHLDHPAPRVDAAAFARRRGAWVTWGRRAAGIAVAAMLAGAAYAIPGSPLPALVKKVTQWATGSESSTPASSDSLATAATPVTSGIAVPVGSRFSIDFIVEQTSGTVAVSLTEGPNVVVRVFGRSVTFTTDVDRLTIDNRSSTADYEIEIPRSAASVTVSIAGRQMALKDGDTFASQLPLDARGRHVFSLSPREN